MSGQVWCGHTSLITARLRSPWSKLTCILSLCTAQCVCAPLLPLDYDNWTHKQKPSHSQACSQALLYRAAVSIPLWVRLSYCPLRTTLCACCETQGRKGPARGKSPCRASGQTRVWDPESMGGGEDSQKFSSSLYYMSIEHMHTHMCTHIYNTQKMYGKCREISYEHVTFATETFYYSPFLTQILKPENNYFSLK